MKVMIPSRNEIIYCIASTSFLFLVYPAAAVVSVIMSRFLFLIIVLLVPSVNIPVYCRKKP